MTPGAVSALKNLRDYMDDTADSDPPLEEVVALRDSLLRHFAEIPDSEHYKIAYVISETGQVLSGDVRSALERMRESSNEGAAVWSRALLYTFYGEKSCLQDLVERGSLKDTESPGCLDALLPILYAASEGDPAAQKAVDSLYRDPEVGSRVKDIIVREYYT